MWFSCSYTELPRDKQPQIQELPRWDYNHSSCRMVTLSLLFSPWAGRFTGVLLCTYIHAWTCNSVPHILEAKQICQRHGKRNYNHQELNRAKGIANAIQQRECLRAGHSTWHLLSCPPILHIPCSPLLYFSPLEDTCFGGFLKNYSAKHLRYWVG